MIMVYYNNYTIYKIKNYYLLLYVFIDYNNSILSRTSSIVLLNIMNDLDTDELMPLTKN